MNKKGFTLIELLVVISIIAVLASVILASLNSARSNARDSKRLSELKNLQTALEIYYIDNGEYPLGPLNTGCDDNVWATPLAPLVDGGYISEIPMDPVNELPNCYNYASTTTAQSGWYCDGLRRTDYEYAIFLSLENDNDTLKRVSSSSSGFIHCIVGPKK